MKKPRLLATTLALTAVLACGQDVHAKLYRWVDEDGNVHYSDRVPPEDALRERSQLDARGLTVKVYGAAKTDEEKAREEQLKRLRETQKKLIREQLKADRVLLRTFRTESDINLARDKRLAAIDVKISVARTNRNRVAKRLEEMQINAASLELTGRKVSEAAQRDMDDTNRQVRDIEKYIDGLERDKQKVRDRFAEDVVRFRALKELDPSGNLAVQVATNDAPLFSLYQCKDNGDCERAWKRAEAFAQAHATVEMRMVGERVLATAAPLRDSDIAIAVSRIPGSEPGTADQLFMDIQCKNSPLGEELCNGDKVRTIVGQFRDFVARQGD